MTAIDGLILHEFPNPQADDPLPHDHTLPSDWNNGHILGGGTDGDLLTCKPANASRGGFRTLVGANGLVVTFNATQITIGTGGASVISGTGTTNKVTKWTGAGTIGDSNITDNGANVAINGTVNTFEQVSLKGTFAPSAAGAALGISTTITAVVNASHFGIDIYPTINKAGSGTHTTFASAAFEAVTVGAGGAALTNTATVLITGVSNAGTNNYALWSQAGSFLIAGAGPHAFGTALNTRFQVLVNPAAFTAVGGAFASGWSFQQNITGPSGQQVFAVDVSPGTLTAVGSPTDTGSFVVQAHTLSGAGVTNASTVKIIGAPSGATNNRSLWVAAGVTQFDGLTGIGVVPTVPLDVATNNATANVRVTDNTNGARIRTVAGACTVDLYNSGGAGQFMVISNHSMNFYTNNILRATIGASGNMGYNTSPQSGILFDVAGAFTSLSATQVEGLSCRATLTPGGNFNGFGGVYLPTIAAGANNMPLAVGAFYGVSTTISSGSITSAISLYVDAPAGAAATNAASLYVAAGPTIGATVNYAIWVDSGKTRLDNQLTIPTYDSHVIGSLTGNTGIGLLITSSFASGQAFARGLQIDATMTANADNGSLIGLYMNPVLTERGAGTHGVLAGMYLQPSVVAGAANTTNFSAIYIDAITAQSGTTNAAGITIGTAPTGATTNYAILAAGSLRMTDAISHAFGTTLDADVHLKFGGTFAGTANSYGIHLNTTLTGVAGNNIIGIRVTPTLVEAGSGTHAIEAGIYVQPTVTAGAGNATDAAGVLIDTFAAASGTTTVSGLKVVIPTGSATNTYGIWTTGVIRCDQNILLTAPNIRTDAGNAYSLGITDNYVIVNKAAVFTLTLPTASTNTGRAIYIMTYTANAVNSASSNVNSKTGVNGTAILGGTAGFWCVLVSDGTNWLTVATNQ